MAESKLEELGRLISQERGARDMLRTSLQQRLDTEKLARDAQSAFMDDKLKYFGDLIGDATKRQSSEFEAVVGSHVGKQSRELEATKTCLQNRISELERVLAEGSIENNQVKETLRKETRMREAALRDIHELLAKEKNIREQQQELCQELLRASTEAAVVNFGKPSNAEALAEECRLLGDRLRALQRSMHSCETLMTKETEQRCKEIKCVWDVINAGGLRLETSPERTVSTWKRSPEDGQDDVDTYVPFPCQPLTAFLRLGSHAEDGRRRLGGNSPLAEGGRRRSRRGIAFAGDVSPPPPPTSTSAGSRNASPTSTTVPQRSR